MKHTFSLGYLTIPGTHPADQIEIAAACGYDGVGLRPISMRLPGEPDYHFTNETLYKSVRGALTRTGVKLFDIELARIADGVDVRDYEADIARAAELGARYVITSVWTNDRDYALRQMTALCRLCEKYDLLVNLEFMSFSDVPDMEDALGVIREAGCPNLRLMVDILHAHRAGVTAGRLAKVPPNLLGFVHICDGLEWIPPVYHADMKGVAREKRLYMGEGGIDVAGMLKAMPYVPYYAVELPNLAAMEAGGKLAHAKRCLETAKKFMAEHEIQ